MPEELHFANPELFELFTQASKLTISQQRDVTKMISGLIDNSDPLDHANPELISLFETARRVSPERQREFTQMISLFTENI
jgi:hemoglobin-like flavoprotein